MTATATAKSTIYWNKPIEARFDRDDQWREAVVLTTKLKGYRSVAIAVEVGFGREHDLFRCDREGSNVQRGDSDCRLAIRNVPAAPVPFEFTRWVNVYQGCDKQGNFCFPSKEEAETVPVTIRGEWKEEESNG